MENKYIEILNTFIGATEKLLEAYNKKKNVYKNNSALYNFYDGAIFATTTELNDLKRLKEYIKILQK